MLWRKLMAASDDCDAAPARDSLSLFWELFNTEALALAAVPGGARSGRSGADVACAD
jgi:hypothetical protein